MATALRATVDEYPAVVEAVKHLAPLRARRVELEREMAEAFLQSGQADASAVGFAHTDESTQILATHRLSQLRGELDMLRVREIPAEREVNAARAEARRELASALQGRQRKALATLNAALAAAAIANAVAQLDQETEAVLGTGALKFAWHELLEDRTDFDSRISAWRRAARSHGLL